MNKISNKGLSHILVILLFVIVVVGGSGWFIYTRQSKNDKNQYRSGTDELSIDSYEETIKKINETLAEYSPNYRENGYYLEKEYTKDEVNRSVEVSIPKAIYWEIRPSPEKRYDSLNIEPKQISKKIEDLGFTKIKDESGGLTTEIIYEKDLIKCKVGGTEDIWISVVCINKDLLKKYWSDALEAFIVFKNTDAYKKISSDSRYYISGPTGLFYSLKYDAPKDSSVKGVTINTMINGYGRSAYMADTGSGWKLVFEPSWEEFYKDGPGPETSKKECDAIFADNLEGVFGERSSLDCPLI